MTSFPTFQNNDPWGKGGPHHGAMNKENADSSTVTWEGCRTYVYFRVQIMSVNNSYAVFTENSASAMTQSSIISENVWPICPSELTKFISLLERVMRSAGPLIPDLLSFSKAYCRIHVIVTRHYSYPVRVIIPVPLCSTLILFSHLYIAPQLDEFY